MYGIVIGPSGRTAIGASLPGAPDLGRERLAQIRDRLEVRAPHLVGRQLAEQADARLQQTPAISCASHWSYIEKPGASDRVEQRARRLVLEQQLLEVAVLGEPVVAARGGRDVAVGRHDLRGGRHALDRLIEVLVERVAAVRRHDDRKRLLARHHRRLRENAQPASWAAMTSPQKNPVISRAPVQRHVDAEVDRQQRAVVADPRLGRDCRRARPTCCADRRSSGRRDTA